MARRLGRRGRPRRRAHRRRGSDEHRPGRGGRGLHPFRLLLRRHRAAPGALAHALQQPVAAVASLLGRAIETSRPVAPYFWSDQYGARLQFAGHRLPGDAVEVLEGDLESRRFVAGYRRDGELVAVFAMNQPKLFGKWRRQLVPARAAVAHPS
ncbi:oxidoreductase C-terminal domain-containing protein [Pseudonocardia nigra]|uniref:oxidoreductase C-terminal domain-containing protein n=1 Tax=Pseudonocardia nigra TaxID=1921578 RepID=UPI003558B6A1